MVAFDEKIIVTTALPYSNGEIHLGHIASTYLPADIFVRYLRLKGKNVIFVCGDDDFGTPILVKAEEKGISPKAYVDLWHEDHKKDFSNLGISFDFYYYTSSEEHIKLVQHFFKVLLEKGFIFEKEIEQFYCEYDKKFLPDRFLKGTCPFCGAKDQYGDGCEKCGRTYEPFQLKNPKCSICGRKPIVKKSLHYFFKLSAFSDKLKDWLVNNKNLENEVKNYVLRWIEEGLKDWDITRDISWGVPIPLEKAKGKVLYGWFDNHLGYISFTLKYLKEKNLDGKEFWNSSKIYHFIGKDIVYHHYLFLPAMRIAEGSFKLPDFIPTRGHLLLLGKKISKSRGWYISVKDFIKKFNSDYLRYYLASIIPYSQADVNFDWDEFQAKINNELVANIGNFIHRTLTFIWKNFDGKIPEPERNYEDAEKYLREIFERVGELIERNETDKALREIVNFSSFFNQFFQKNEPWKTKDKTCLFLCANAVACLSILLEPYIPFSAKKIWELLNLSERRSWKMEEGYFLPPNHKINEPKIIFEKIEEQKIEEEKSKFA